MQVVMNKYFLLNPEKELAQIRLVFEKNAKTIQFRCSTILKKMTSSSQRLGYFNNLLNCKAFFT